MESAYSHVATKYFAKGEKNFDEPSRTTKSILGKFVVRYCYESLWIGGQAANTCALFIVPSKILHSNGEVTIAEKGLQHFSVGANGF